MHKQYIVERIGLIKTLVNDCEVNKYKYWVPNCQCIVDDNIIYSR